MKIDQIKTQESVLPANKSVDELLLTPAEELQEYANKAGVTVEKLSELLVSASERKHAAMEAQLAKRDHVEKPVDERAEAIRNEILAALDNLDFFELAVVPGDSEALEDTAYSFLNKVEDEKDDQKRKALVSSAETYFRESQKAWAGKRASDLMREGKSQREALVQVANEMQARMKSDNVSERVNAAQEIAGMVWGRSYNTEMFEALEKLRQAYAAETPSEEDTALMRKLVLAARGTYLRSAANASMVEKYGVGKFLPIVGKLGRAYARAAGFKLDQNSGALGSIERFELDLPNSYNAQGSPRSRPRRSAIPEERY